MTPGTNGNWTEKVLHSFNHDGKDGVYPYASLIADAAGNLYSTSASGGTHPFDCDGYGCGTIFQLTPETNGKWTEKVLHSFDGDGIHPYASLIFDASGNLYGTTYRGGDAAHECLTYNVCGTVFEITP